MKSVFKKIFSVTLAILVLTSTFSFTVAKHYCGEFLVDVSFSGETEGCGMSKKMMKTTRKNCCKDEVHKIDGQDELQQFSKLDLDFEKQQFLVAFVYSYRNLFIPKEKQLTYFIDFSPPDNGIDYQVLYQTFLI